MRKHKAAFALSGTWPGRRRAEQHAALDTLCASAVGGVPVRASGLIAVLSGLHQHL